MEEASGERLLRRTNERLDDVERLLLKPEPAGLGALVENLEVSWRELCALELAVRRGGVTPGLRVELEEVRGRVSRLAMLLEHARRMVDGWQMAVEGVYGGDGRPAAEGRGALGRLDEEG